MKYLIIYVHPREDSFNHALLEQVTGSIEEKGCEVQIRDLYREKFNPLLSAADMALLQAGEIPDDIKIEQQFLSEADKVIVIHPIWWIGMPALMKGYIDRVLNSGFAYKYQDGKVVGLMNEKPLLLINTTGNADDRMEEQGIKQVLKTTMDVGVYEFCGFKVQKLFLPAVPYVGKTKRAEYLKLVKERIQKF